MATFVISDSATSVGSPADGDSVYFEGGNSAVVTNVDQSALTNGFVNVVVRQARTGNIGTAADPFYSEITGQLIYGAQAGTMYWRCKNTTDATPLVQVIGAGDLQFVTGGTATRFEMLSGSSTISGACLATNVRASGGSLYIINTGSSTAQTLLHLMAGASGGPNVRTERGATTATVDAGTLTIDNDATAITTLNCYGSHATAKTIIEDTGTITTLNCYGHVPDVSRLSRPVTITNTNINMSLPGAFALLVHPDITFTNTPTKYITQ